MLVSKGIVRYRVEQTERTSIEAVMTEQGRTCIKPQSGFAQHKRITGKPFIKLSIGHD